MENFTESVSDHAKAAENGIERCYADGENYVRANPTKSALVAMGVGFLLAQLPLRWMFVAVIKVVLLLVKPATFIYAISKLVDDVRTPESD
ncbi:MAG: hypothetical protein QOD99_1500 [Chthoniobacter sp.]|jgi:hypothetical protein|nr:hypothetical protein [Chthoniobacter sp.]